MSDRSHVDTEAMTDIENTDTTEDMQAIRLDVDDLLKFNASDVKGANVHGHRRGGSRKRKNHFSLRKSAAYVFGSHGSNRRSEHQHHHRHQYHHGRSHGWSKGVKILVAVLILFLALILIEAGVIAFKWYRAGSMNATMFKDKSTLQLQDAAPMQRNKFQTPAMLFNKVLTDNFLRFIICTLYQNMRFYQRNQFSRRILLKLNNIINKLQCS